MIREMESGGYLAERSQPESGKHRHGGTFAVANPNSSRKTRHAHPCGLLLGDAAICQDRLPGQLPSRKGAELGTDTSGLKRQSCCQLENTTELGVVSYP